MSKKARAPWEDPKDILEKADVIALKQVAAGKGDENHQKRVIDLIVTKLAETYGLSYRPDNAGGERDTAFAEGKRFVGLQVVRLLKSNPNDFTTKE